MNCLHHAAVAALATAIVISSARAAAERAPVLPADQPGSMALLLGVETVRDELKLTSRQRAALDAIRGDYRDAARAAVAKAKADTESKKAAQAQIDALTDRFDGRAMDVLNSTQTSRLAEIEHQVLGGYMLLSPEVQRQLGLTPAQKSQIAKIYAKSQTYASEVNGWFEDGEVSFYERLLYLREDREARSEAMLKLLTPAQLAKLHAMEGTPFFTAAS